MLPSHFHIKQQGSFNDFCGRYLRQANVFWSHVFHVTVSWHHVVNKCMGLKLTVIMPWCQILKLCSCHGEFGPSDQTNFYVGPILVNVNAVQIYLMDSGSAGMITRTDRA